MDGRTNGQTDIQHYGKAESQQLAFLLLFVLEKCPFHIVIMSFLRKKERYKIRALNMKFRCIHGSLIEVEVCIRTANISFKFYTCSTLLLSQTVS